MWEQMCLEENAMVMEGTTQIRWIIFIELNTYITLFATPFQALAVIKQASLSAAVFAPGWVYETQPKRQFFHNQDK